MKVISLPYAITRSTLQEHTKTDGTYKKLYNGSLSPECPEIMKSAMEALKSLSLQEANTAIASLSSFAIMPEDTLVVVDTDSAKAYNDITQLTAKLPETFVVMSDQGFGHFYYTPTPYFLSSPVAHTSRRDVGDIDVLQGKCLTWGYGEGNSTKRAPSSRTLLDTKAIPDTVVDYLIASLAKEAPTKRHSDNQRNTTYIGTKLMQALTQVELMQDSKSKEYTSLQLWEPFHDIARYLIPNRYKASMNKQLHPDSLPSDTSASAFVQASVTKMLLDPSISEEMGRLYLTLVTTELWSGPIDLAQLNSYLTNYTTQGPKFPYLYDPSIMQAITGPVLVSLNKGPYGKAYIATDDTFRVEASNELVNMGKWGSFKIAMTMQGNSYATPDSVDNFKFTHRLAKAGLPLEITPRMQQIALVSDITKPYGLVESEKAIQIYNTFVPTVYMDIITGIEPEPASSPEDFIDFKALFFNICADHPREEQEKLFMQFMLLLKHKALFKIYCALVFQLNGKEGVGKGVFVSILSLLLGGKRKLDVEKTNKHHNAEAENCMIGQQSEIAVTHKNWEAIKVEAGEEIKTIEPKGVDSYQVPNVETLIVETNGTDVFEDERRIVLMQGHTGQPWNYSKNMPRVILQLRALCAFIRDLDDKRFHSQTLEHASYWNGATFKNAKSLARTSTGKDTYLELLEVYTHYKTMSGGDIHTALENALDISYWHMLKHNSKELWVILTNKGQRREGEECTYYVAPTQLVSKGLQIDVKGEQNDIGRDTNHNKSRDSAYAKVPVYLRFRLSSAQYEELQEAISNVPTYMPNIEP